MSWEQRGGQSYYYTARRVNGRVVKEYVHPLVAPARALVDADRRAMREEAAAELRRARADLDALDAALVALDELADALARGALLAAGYHQHHRGPWRKRRVRQDHPTGEGG
ncbi:MAG: hypothetical protein JWO38_2205 [Gemmataceae bacterium]|nr:hypothetical protein [Gemmataceae bacterium]